MTLASPGFRNLMVKREGTGAAPSRVGKGYFFAGLRRLRVSTKQ